MKLIGVKFQAVVALRGKRRDRAYFQCGPHFVNGDILLFKELDVQDGDIVTVSLKVKKPKRK